MNAPAFRTIGRRALACALLALATVTAASPALARADGDPASDVLVSQPLFLPYDANVAVSQQSELTALLKAAQKAGFAIRVAMVPSEYDLGSVGVLWDKARTYARFLGIELSLTYAQRLLVVMPNGFGFNWPHHSSAAAYKVLAKIPIGRGGSGLLDATEAAVRGLAAAEGIDISSSFSLSLLGLRAPARRLGARPVRLTSHSRSASCWFSPPLPWLSWWSRKRHGGEAGRGLPALRRKMNDLRAARVTRRAPGEPGSDGAGLGFSAARRWVLSGAVAFCVAAGVPLLVLRGGFRGAAGSSAAGSSAGEAPAIFPEGERPTPNFHLIDQKGHGVSPAVPAAGRSMHHHRPLCRESCPLAAQVLAKVKTIFRRAAPGDHRGQRRRLRRQALRPLPGLQ